VLITTDAGNAPTTAISVVSSKSVIGPVDSVDVIGNQLMIAGQTVQVDGATIIDDSAGNGVLSGIAIDDVIAVSGFADGLGGIHATRIEGGSGDVEVHGVISNLDSNNKTFSLGTLTVDYGAVPAVIDDSFPVGGFMNGDPVEAKGSAIVGGTLLASEIERDDLEGKGVTLGDFDAAEGEIEGLITRFASVADFDVDGLPVFTDSATQFKDGTAGDLALNVRVEAEGPIDQNGILLADEIKFRRDDEVRIAALVDSVDVAASEIVVLGLTIGVDSLTRIEDQSDANVDPLSVSQINANDYVEIRGSLSADPGVDVIAGILERDDSPAILGEETELRGRLTQVLQPSVMIGSISITTDGATEYRDTNGALISQAQFFAAAAVGDLADISGVEIMSQTVLAQEISLKVN